MEVIREYTQMYKPQQLSIPFDRTFLDIPVLAVYGRFLESEQAVKGEYYVCMERWATKQS